MKRNQESTVIDVHATELVVRRLMQDDVELGPVRVRIPKRLLPSRALVEGAPILVKIELLSPHTRYQWSQAYVEQGLSDLVVFDLLNADETIPACHRLHYIQMASEKIAKAHLFMEDDRRIGELLTKHVGVAELMKAHFRSPAVQQKYAGKSEQLDNVKKEMVSLAKEIEKLAPAVERDSAPTNVEYPWSNGRELTVPCNHRFGVELDIPHNFRQFVRILRDAAQELKNQLAKVKT